MSIVNQAYPRFMALDENGEPAAGYLVYTYYAGTDTPLATYKDYTILQYNTNPIVLDSTGQADIYLTVLTKFVLTEPGGDPSSPVWERDYLGGIFDATGAPGPQGPQGYQGTQGFQGNQGNQGYQGHQGNQGNQGYQGYQGHQGNQGYQGNQGDQGPQGDQGYQGTQGFQGNQGNQGYQGHQGNQGNQGYQGYQGVTGAPSGYGAIGFVGQTSVTVNHNLGSYPVVQVLNSSGVEIVPDTVTHNSLNNLTVTFNTSTTGTILISLGSSNTPGPQGYQGTIGLTGPQGNQGYQGQQGYQGNQGYQGAFGGPQGDQGAQGNQGYQGSQGSAVTAGYIATAFTSQTSVTVTHNLGSYPAVQVLDSGNVILLPNTITHSSVNAFTVTFNSSTTGTIITTAGSAGTPSVVSKGTNYTITIADRFIKATAAITLTLPAASTATGITFVVKRVTTAGDVTIARAGSDLIDGATSVVLNVNYAAVALLSDGSAWNIV